MTMPGLPKVPAAEKIDVDENGVITGLFWLESIRAIFGGVFEQHNRFLQKGRAASPGGPAFLQLFYQEKGKFFLDISGKWLYHNARII